MSAQMTKNKLVSRPISSDDVSSTSRLSAIQITSPFHVPRRESVIQLNPYFRACNSALDHSDRQPGHLPDNETLSQKISAYYSNSSFHPCTFPSDQSKLPYDFANSSSSQKETNKTLPAYPYESSSKVSRDGTNQAMPSYLVDHSYAQIAFYPKWQCCESLVPSNPVKYNPRQSLNRQPKYFNKNIKYFYCFKLKITTLNSFCFDRLENCHRIFSYLEKSVIILFSLTDVTYYIGFKIKSEEFQEINEARARITEAIINRLNSCLLDRHQMSLRNFDRAFPSSLINFLSEKFLEYILPPELVKEINLNSIVSTYNRSTLQEKILLIYYWLKIHPTMFFCDTKKEELAIVFEALLVIVHIKKNIESKHHRTPSHQI